MASKILQALKNTGQFWIPCHLTDFIILSIILCIFSASIFVQMQGYQFTFIDTDDYMRVVRIREFFQHHDLYNNVIARCNVPYGCSLHWTRFYDFFIIIPTYILSFFTDSINNAIDYVCFIISPIIRVITICIFMNMLRKNDLITRDNTFWILLFFAINPLITAYGNFGRPDHHAFIVLFMLLFLDRYLDAVKSNFEKHHLSIARLTTLCIWISPETLIPLLIMDGITFLWALKSKDQKICNFLFLKNAEVLFYIGLLLFLAQPSTEFDIGGIFVYLMIRHWAHSSIKNQRGMAVVWAYFLLPGVWALYKDQSVLYDEISSIHLLLYALISYFFYAVSRSINAKNLKEIICSPRNWSVLFLCLLFIALWPKFFMGMGADVTPYVKEIWLNRVGEMRSPFEDSYFSYVYVFHAFFVIMGIINKLYEIFSEKYQEDYHKTFCWIVFIVLSGTYVIMAGFANRMLLFSFLFSIPLIVEFGMSGAFFSRFRRMPKIFATTFMTTLFFLLSALLSSDDNEGSKSSGNSEETYTKKELYREIDKLSPNPEVIIAHSNDGPSILYYTKHCAVGAPYHRQQQGIIASYEVLEAPYNEEKIKKILRETNASYILIVGYSKTENQQNNSTVAAINQIKTLPDMAVQKQLPEWLKIVEIPKRFTDVIVLKVDKYALKN